MPTSSQALLLKNTGRSDLSLDRIPVVAKKSSIGTCSQRELTPCPVSHVDINELWKSSVLDNGEHLIVEDLTNLVDEKDSSVVKSEFNIKGYKTVLSYNKSSGSFSWRFNQPDETDSTENREPETKILPSSLRTRPKTGVGTERTRVRKSAVRSRPKTAGGADSKRQTVTFAKPLHYSRYNKGDKLVCFGLRAPSTKGTRSKTTELKSIRKKNAPSYQGAWTNPSSTGSRNLESGGDGAVTVKMKGLKADTEPPKPPCCGAAKAMLTRVWKEFDKQRQITSTENEKCGEEKNEDDIYATSFANRVQPSIYMRKDPPDAGPFDVCFSLRHNEAVSHDELRESILRQTGVNPVQMKYEALSIRVGDYGIRNRWIVKTGSQKDFNQLIDSGLFIDNDNIVVLPLSEIMEREFRTYRFLTQTKSEHAAARIGTKLKKNTIQNKSKVE